jgi:diadenosine tetraphosphate (Ap4A) HIT family hydrolase
MSSPFLERPESDWIASNALAFAIFDGFPVSPGHALIIPKRLVATWFEATPDEQQALMALVETVKARLDRDYQPDGYNIGVNVGEAGGQTVFHLHVHLIPRYRGDMDDPRGGVRHVIPWKGNYKRAPVTRLATGGDDPFQAHLLPLFESAEDIAIVAAFVQDTGLLQLQRPLREASARGGGS